MRVQISQSLVTFLLSAVLATGATRGWTAQVPGATSPPNARGPELEALVTGVESAQHSNHGHMVPYTVTREYELFSGADKQANGTVVVEVRFQPPATKTWEIKKTSGSGRAEKVVKRVLEHEVKYTKEGKIAITRENYDFRYAGTGESAQRPCYRLELIPKRNDSGLLSGWIWVDRDTYLIHRFEGEPAKSPSWWIRQLKLSTRYSDLGGIWLPTTRKGVADVRMFGRHTMTERTLDYHAVSEVRDGPAAEQARLTHSHR